MIDYINKNFGRHIVTIEEPIEFTFEDKKSVINQREIGTDVWSYKDALKQFALHSPDIVYIGNIRDVETCHAALTIAQNRSSCSFYFTYSQRSFDSGENSQFLSFFTNIILSLINFPFF